MTEQQVSLLIRIDPSSGVPVYRQLMDQIRLLVAGGILAPGDPLPSTRALSAELGVNPMTISKAYSFLERDGLVERRPGLPLLVKALEPDRLQREKLEQLREGLGYAASLVRQLGIDPEEALEVFEQMLSADSDEESSS